MRKLSPTFIYFFGALGGLLFGYDRVAEFYNFDYKELGDKVLPDGSYTWKASESRFD